MIVQKKKALKKKKEDHVLTDPKSETREMRLKVCFVTIVGR